MQPNTPVWIEAEPLVRLPAQQPGEVRDFIRQRIGYRMDRHQPGRLRLGERTDPTTGGPPGVALKGHFVLFFLMAVWKIAESALTPNTA